MRDEHDTKTADLLPTAETDKFLAERGMELKIGSTSDKAGRTNSLDAIDAADLVATITRIAERVAERVADAAHTSADEVAQLTADLRAVKTELIALQRDFGDIDTAAEIDGDAVWDEIEYRVTDAAETAASEAAGEIDADAIWAEISDRVDEAAAAAARQVIRDDLVVTVDLI